MPEGELDPKDVVVLTPGDIEKADEYGRQLTERLPLVDPFDLADAIDEQLEHHLHYLMNQEEKTVEQLCTVASQMGWWCVLLITKLRAKVLDELAQSGRLVVPPGGGAPS